MIPLRHRLAALSRRRRVALAIVVSAGGIAILGWLAVARDDALTSLPEARVSATVSADSPTGGASAAAPQALPRVAVGAAPAQRDPGRVEVCGLGEVEVPVDATFLDPKVLAQIPGIEESVGATLARMRGSPDPFARSAAAVIEMTGPGAAAGDLRERLAHDALTTRDPRIYSLAFEGCTKAGGAGSCALLSIAQWARLDEANAAPWLFALDAAVERRDKAGVDEALHRIGTAARFEDRHYAVAGQVAAHAGTSDSDLIAAQLLMTNALGVAAARWSPVQTLTVVCDASALANANRRQACDAAATLMTERSDSALISLLGTTIGRRVGWPVERLAAIGAWNVALQEMWASDPDPRPRLGVSYSCAGVRSALDRVDQLSRLGEPALARQWMASSGKPGESYLRVAREQETRRRAREAEEASRPRTTAVVRVASAAEPAR